MRTLINPTFDLNIPKGKEYIYSICLCKRNLDQLTIKVRSNKNKNEKRIIGHITRDYKMVTKNGRFGDGFFKHYDSSTHGKIELMLDLIFGKKRDKFPVINKKGYVEFTK